MTTTDPVRVLLVEDDEDDYVLTRAMLRENGRMRVELDRVESYGEALTAIGEGRHDLYLVDYRLGDRTGLDLVRAAWTQSPHAPVVLLTGQDDYAVDLEATELGVTDYLVKGRIDSQVLERTIRYAVRQHDAMVELRRSEERYAVAVSATNDGIWDWDVAAGTLHCSDRWKALLGYERMETDEPSAWLDLVHPDDRPQLEAAIEGHAASDSPYFESEHRIRHARGEWRWFLTRGLTTRDAEGRPVRVIGSISDVTDRRLAEEQLVHDALHDALTGLPNRTLFMDRLRQSLGHGAREPGYGCAVLYVDVDRFKLVNDGFSHAAGDRLLVELARRIDGVLRPGDTVARRGGDEFTVLLDGISSPTEATAVATRVEKAIAVPVPIDDTRSVSVTASIGISHCFGEMADCEELVRNADIAMYDVKGRGGGGWQVFDASMHEHVVTRLSLEARLRAALDEGTMRAFFQPIVDLRTGALQGFEALARWPEGDEQVTPAQFVPVAEDAGLVGPLGTAMLRRACETLADWQRRSLVGSHVAVSVNVSLRQIGPGFPADVRATLAETGLAPTSLALEITETTLMDNRERVDLVLGELIDMGVAIHLDDFGTGYSSLTVLHDFRGDTLKIDRSFVETMEARSESRAIIRSIVGLAHNLGMRVVAEGIETVAQRDALARLGCESGQGYHFAPPLPADEVEAMLARAEAGAPIALGAPAQPRP